MAERRQRAGAVLSPFLAMSDKPCLRFSCSGLSDPPLRARARARTTVRAVCRDLTFTRAMAGDFGGDTPCFA